MADEKTPDADGEELSEQDLEYVTEELADETTEDVVGGGLGEAGMPGGAGLGEAGVV